MDNDEEDDDVTPKKVKHGSGHKKGKKKARSKRRSEKHGLDISAMTNEQAALAALESNHLLQLKLRKRYYTEAMSFIRMIESAMEVVTQLLGSKNKPEVLEAMEFFKVAHDYELANAEVGLFQKIVSL